MSVSRCSPTSRLPCSGSQQPIETRSSSLFVTTDPARDKEKQIRRYLDRFNPAFVGLTGPLSTIKRAASQVGVDIQGMKRLPSGGYEVGHSAQVIGFSRNSGVVLWTPGTPIASLKHDFALLVDRSR